MCDTHTLFNFEPPATERDCDASLEIVRKISGCRGAVAGEA